MGFSLNCTTWELIDFNEHRDCKVKVDQDVNDEGCRKGIGHGKSKRT